jgi:hypothetical protein
MLPKEIVRMCSWPVASDKELDPAIQHELLHIW